MIINATDGLQDHVEELYLATALATNITDQLQYAAHTASWYSSLNQQDGLPGLVIRAACILVACIVLQFQSDSTVVAKVGLLSGSKFFQSQSFVVISNVFSGLVFGEVVINIKRYDWSQLYFLLSDNFVSNWTFPNLIPNLTRWVPFKMTSSHTTAAGGFGEEDDDTIVRSDDYFIEDAFEEDVDTPIFNESDESTQNIFDDASDSTFSLQRIVRSRHL